MAHRDDEDEDARPITQTGRRIPKRKTITDANRIVPGLDEVHRRIDEEVHRRIDSIDEDVSRNRDDLIEVHKAVARLEGHLEHYGTWSTQQSEWAMRAAAAELEMRKAERLASIKDTSEDRAAKRVLWKEGGLKLLVVLMGLWAIVSSILARKC
jgi:chromosome segregation ATPase